jgi:hypothetical protein
VALPSNGPVSSSGPISDSVPFVKKEEEDTLSLEQIPRFPTPNPVHAGYVDYNHRAMIVPPNSPTPHLDNDKPVFDANFTFGHRSRPANGSQLPPPRLQTQGCLPKVEELLDGVSPKTVTAQPNAPVSEAGPQPSSFADTQSAVNDGGSERKRKFSSSSSSLSAEESRRVKEESAKDGSSVPQRRSSSVVPVHGSISSAPELSSASGPNQIRIPGFIFYPNVNINAGQNVVYRTGTNSEGYDADDELSVRESDGHKSEGNGSDTDTSDKIHTSSAASAPHTTVEGTNPNSEGSTGLPDGFSTPDSSAILNNFIEPNNMPKDVDRWSRGPIYHDREAGSTDSSEGSVGIPDGFSTSDSDADLEHIFRWSDRPEDESEAGSTGSSEYDSETGSTYTSEGSFGIPDGFSTPDSDADLEEHFRWPDSPEDDPSADLCLRDGTPANGSTYYDASTDEKTGHFPGTLWDVNAPTMFGWNGATGSSFYSAPGYSNYSNQIPTLFPPTQALGIPNSLDNDIPSPPDVEMTDFPYVSDIDMPDAPSTYY